MKQIIDALKKELRNLNNLIRMIESSKIEVEGTLEIVRKKKEGVLLYKYVNENTPPEYLNASKTAVSGPLAKKRYESMLYKTAKARAKAIEKALKPLEDLTDKEDLQHIYEDLPPEIKGYVTPLLDDDEEYARKWQQQRILQSDMPMKTKYRTLRGGFVRSKSEALIADRLYAMGIPYHYEPLIGRRDGPLLCPDFLVLNKRTGKSYYWEHFGMMDDAIYSNRCMEKIAEYADMGYLVGIDLIATFESATHPLDTGLVERTIEAMLM